LPIMESAVELRIDVSPVRIGIRLAQTWIAFLPVQRPHRRRWLKQPGSRAPRPARVCFRDATRQRHSRQNGNGKGKASIHGKPLDLVGPEIRHRQTPGRHATAAAELLAFEKRKSSREHHRLASRNHPDDHRYVSRTTVEVKDRHILFGLNLDAWGKQADLSSAVRASSCISGGQIGLPAPGRC